MLSSGTLSTVVRQLAVEVHFGSGRSSRTRSVQQWNILAGLERAGFRRWSYRPNAVGVSYQRHNKLYRIAQHEIVYLNRRFYLPPWQDDAREGHQGTDLRRHGSREAGRRMTVGILLKNTIDCVFASIVNVITNVWMSVCTWTRVV